MREAEHSPSSLEACCPLPPMPFRDRCCPDPSERRPGQLPRSRDGQPGEALLHIGVFQPLFHVGSLTGTVTPVTHTHFYRGVYLGYGPVPVAHLAVFTQKRIMEDRGVGVTFYKI